jgi:hypothetical protein
MNTRRYYRGCEAEIASEVVLNRKSEGWVASEKEIPHARRAERALAKFNIGYVDDMRGGWKGVRGGTDFFENL